ASTINMVDSSAEIGAEMVATSNLLFSAYGDVVQPPGLTRVAQLLASGLVCVDSKGRRAFYLAQDNSRWMLTAFSADSLQPIGTQVIEGVQGAAANLVHCKDGL